MDKSVPNHFVLTFEALATERPRTPFNGTEMGTILRMHIGMGAMIVSSVLGSDSAVNLLQQVLGLKRRRRAFGVSALVDTRRHTSVGLHA